MNKIPIAPTLKSLGIYKSANFSLKQYTSVNAAIQRLQTESEKKFTQKKNKREQVLEVTRTA